MQVNEWFVLALALVTHGTFGQGVILWDVYQVLLNKLTVWCL